MRTAGIGLVLRYVSMVEWYVRLSVTSRAKRGTDRLRSRLIIFISIVQTIIFLGHLFIYFTWSGFFGAVATSLPVKLSLAVLSISFVAASLWGWYSHNPVTRLLYLAAALWLGFASYFLWASVLSWLVYGLSLAFGLGWAPLDIAELLFGLALAVSIYGLINAYRPRVVRKTIQLPNLPEQWRGRTAALVSDLHLGHIRNGRFIRAVLDKLKRLEPDVVFIAGDMYDGVAADFDRLAKPWADFLEEAKSKQAAREEIAAGEHETVRQSGAARLEIESATAVLDPETFLGVYYIGGNHEEFYSDAEFLPPLLRAGVQVLDNEKVELDGLQLAGVHYRDAVDPARYRALLKQLRIDRKRASVLLLHAPVHLPVSEAEGISLQLSGHTHGGQFFPYTLIAKRVWGDFIYGLKRLGNMQVYTSYGAGTWGPPMRVGTRPEIVLITFV